jgi:hypothetical protein
VIKAYSIALLAIFAISSAVAIADDPDYSVTSTRHLQPCMAKEMARNDVRTDSDLTQYCTARMRKGATNLHNVPDSIAPSPQTATSRTSPHEAMPKDNGQEPR